MLKHIVKPMQRGQVTIPQDIRDKMNITPETYLWVKMISGDKIIIQTVIEEPDTDPEPQTLSKKEQKWLKATSSLFPELENEPDIYSRSDGKPYERQI